jgi:hypothetical protein
VNNRLSLEELEQRLRSAGQQLNYPPTPELAREVPVQRRSYGPVLRQLALALLLLLALALAVPPVRAAVLRVLQIGVVQVVVQEPVAQSPPTPVSLPENSLLSDLAGETTLAAARDRLPFAIKLPTYPPDLGPPDQVFLQDLDGNALMLIWRDPAEPAAISMSLHLLTSRVMAEKTIFGSYETTILQETAVAGQPALWVRGPHFLQLKESSSGYAFRRLVDGNVLIWTADSLTYRLETLLPLEEALRIAESLEE